MAACPKCSYANRDGAKRCGGCGEPIMSSGVGYNNAPMAPMRMGPPPAPKPQGNFNPTVAAGSPQDNAGVKQGGAVESTVFEGGAGGAGPRQGDHGTVIASEETKPLAGWLVVMRSRSLPAYQDIPIFHGRNILGRGSTTDPRHIVDDGKCSEQHVLLVGSEDGVQLTDMGSSNGTVVNNQEVQNVALNKGDKVRIGKTTMVFVTMPSGD